MWYWQAVYKYLETVFDFFVGSKKLENIFVCTYVALKQVHDENEDIQRQP